MTNSSNSSDENLGNTKQDSPAKMWCFTLNNYTEEEHIHIKECLSSDSSNKWVIGKETGENGTPHLQGFCNFNKKIRLTGLKKYNGRAHWEKCKGSEEQNIKYCTKDNNYELHNIKLKRPLKLLKEEQLYPWQKDIIELIKQEPDDRSLYWFWEPVGKAGKTTFSKYLSAKYGAIPVEGKKNDILYTCAEFESDIYIFGFERTMEDYVPYGAMEKVKDGYFMCGKYESKPIIRANPHVLIFANFEPDTTTCSADRWIVKRI